MKNLENFNKILSKEYSTWFREATYRNENDSWLSTSFNLAVHVLETLRAKEMTQKDLADKIEVSPQDINKIVKGRKNLSPEMIRRLRSVLEF